MFKDLIESSSRRESRNKTSLVVSFCFHALFVLTLLLIPLLYYQMLPAQILTYVPEYLPPPPPAPPPPPLPVTAATPESPIQVVRLSEDHFVAPEEIPDTLPPPMDDIPDILMLTSSSRGIPGGIPGGKPGTVEGWAISMVENLSATLPAPPPPTKRKQPIRRGGDVLASKLVRRVAPAYPELARRARVQGPVLLQVKVDEVGNVTEINIISGNPLLVQAAVEAVRQWKYSPTLLNDEPVPVIATVTVNFVLN